MTAEPVPIRRTASDVLRSVVRALPTSTLADELARRGRDVGVADLSVEAFRREALRRGLALVDSSGILRLPGLVLDLDERFVTLAGGNPIALTGRQCELLTHLARAYPRSVRCETLLQRIFGRGGGGIENLNELTWQLRREIGPERVVRQNAQRTRRDGRLRLVLDGEEATA